MNAGRPSLGLDDQQSRAETSLDISALLLEGSTRNALDSPAFVLEKSSDPFDDGFSPSSAGYSSYMKTTTLTDAKNGFSALIDQVRAGESITILDRGRPVARIEPLGTYPDPSGRLARLERAGTIRIGAAAPPVDLLRRPAPALSEGASAVQAVIDERRSSR